MSALPQLAMMAKSIFQVSRVSFLRMDPRMKRQVRRLQSLYGKPYRGEQSAQHAEGIHPDQRSHRRHNGGAIDQRQSFLGGEADRRQARSLERFHRGQP